MSWSTPEENALHAKLLDHAAQYNRELPEPDRGEAMTDYLFRLDADGFVSFYDRAQMKNARRYQALVADAEERGVLLVERDPAEDPTVGTEAPTSKADAQALLADPARRADRVKTYEPGHKPLRSSIPRQLTGHVDPVDTEE